MKENWFLIGDIHGDANPITYFYMRNRNRLQLDGCKNTIILLGDVGCNYYANMRDENFKASLSELPFTYICLRGNHESRVTDVVKNQPRKWKRIEKYGGNVYIEKAYPNIEYLEDIPTVYDFNGIKTLSIPGAYSVDKEYRLSRHWRWFENEQLSDEEMNIGRDLVKKHEHFDLVISHTCPIEYEPRDLFLAFIDQTRVDKTMELYLGELEEKLDYERWAFGHFHADRLYPRVGNKQMLMLFNEKVIDLNKFMNMGERDYFDEILA